MNGDEENIASTSSSGPRRSSLLFSLIGRSLSVPANDDANAKEHQLNQEGASEPIFQTADRSAQDGNIKKLRSKSLSTGTADGNSDSAELPDYRPRTLSSVLLGTKNLTMDDGKVVFSQDGNDDAPDNSKKMEDNVFAPNNLNSTDIIASSQPREISQTDHLNRKLLGSFLNRINSMASSFIDPSGTGQTLGQVYTDDVMMDRIIRRVESDSNENINHKDI